MNDVATSIYHNGVVKPHCKEKGIPYRAKDYAQIHGPAMLLDGRLS